MVDVEHDGEVDGMTVKMTMMLAMGLTARFLATMKLTMDLTARFFATMTTTMDLTARGFQENKPYLAKISLISPK